MRSLYQTSCDQAQGEVSNPEAIELEFSYLLREIQQETGLGSEEIHALFDEIELNMADCSCAPPSTNNTVSRKRTLDEREEQFPLPPPSLEEILEFLEEQDTEQVVSTQPNSVLCLRAKRIKLSDDQPCSDWLTAAYVPSPPTRKRNHDEEQNPYIKKPPNAFMLFRAEQRQRVALELGIRDAAKTNAELGRRWNMLSSEEKVPYFEKAHTERRAHQAKYPYWSSAHNYARKVRRRNRAAPTYNHFPASQQPWLYATDASFRPEATYHQDPYNQAWGTNKEPTFTFNHQTAKDHASNDEALLFTPNALLNVAHEAQGFIQGLLVQPFNL